MGRMQVGTTGGRAKFLSDRRALPSGSAMLESAPLPTEHGLAALRRATVVTRECQSDSSSKRPTSSVPSAPRDRTRTEDR